MTENQPPEGSLPGWPSAPVGEPGPPEAAPTGPPTAVPAPPAPAPPAPGYGPPPTGYPSGGFQAPGTYAPPGSYQPPTVYPPPGGGYAPSGYGYGYPTARDHPQGTTILVLGILSIVVCGLLGPVAWIMGNKAIKEIDANPGAYSNRGNVQAGRIIGIVASCLLGAVLAFYAVILVIVGVGSTTS